MHQNDGVALVLTGGGARAAWQVGLLTGLARRFPTLKPPILTGVSAGAINSVFLASQGGLSQSAASSLEAIWRSLTPSRVFRTDTSALGGNVLRWATGLISGGSPLAPKPRALLDISPLAEVLRRGYACSDGDDEIRGIRTSVERGDIESLAVSTLDYATGQTVTWIEGRAVQPWERPQRRAVVSPIGVDHVMASAALPLLFPAQRVGSRYYGDGGVRLAAPLAPAVHLGASKILAVSTRYDRSQHEADQPAVRGYPPIAQVAGALMNAVFLDALDHDAHQLRRISRLVRALPIEHREGLRPIDVLVLRPSRDLGRMSAGRERALPRTFRFLLGGLGTNRTESPDLLSMLLFEPGYLHALIELGVDDADRIAPAIEEHLAS
jgi:NTE family protein